MATNLIIVDSCVFIKAFRKDADAIRDLKAISANTAYSVITQLDKRATNQFRSRLPNSSDFHYNWLSIIDIQQKRF